MPTVSVNGLEIYYEQQGEGPDLVFIHGLGSDHSGWQFQMEFSENFRMLTYDVRGHGRTGKPPGPYSIKMFAEDLAALLDTLKISKAHIVGISMGGWIAFQLTLDRPDLAKTMTIVNSWASMIPENKAEQKEIFKRIVLFNLFSMRKIGQTLSKRLFIKPDQEQLRKDFITQWAQNDKKAYMAAMKAAIGWSVVDRLGEIQCPSLMIAADEDYSPVTKKEAYVKLIPNCSLKIIEDSRHATPIEQAEAFNQALSEFLMQQR